MSIGTVKSRVSRARSALKQMLTGEESTVTGAASIEMRLRAIGQTDVTPTIVA